LLLFRLGSSGSSSASLDLLVIGLWGCPDPDEGLVG
jgi:hypothetical protein